MRRRTEQRPLRRARAACRWSCSRYQPGNVVWRVTQFTAWLLAALLCGTQLAAHAISPPVRTWLKTSWPATPLILEALEYAGNENSTRFFDIIDRAADSFAGMVREPERQQYQHLQNVITSEDQTDVALLKLSLALHATAPAVHALFQLYNTAVLPEAAVRNSSFDPTCDVWVDWYGTQACTVHALENAVAAKRGGRLATELFPFDHIRSPSAKNGSDENEGGGTAVMYADVTSPHFPAMHHALSALVNSQAISYVLRYIPCKSRRLGDPLFLSGYGVELALKSTEYKVIDERDGNSKEQNATISEVDDGNSDDSSRENDADFSAKIESDDGNTAIRPLLAAEMADLPIKSVQYILSAENKLAALQRLAQDFPKHARTVAGLYLNRTLARAIRRPDRLRLIPAGSNGLWINGVSVDERKVEPFFLLDALLTEHAIIRVMTSYGLSKQQAIDLLTCSELNAEKTDTLENVIFSGTFDVRDKSEGGQLVVWWNDLEKDARYKHWPSNIFELMRPSLPGQLRFLRRNLYNVLFVIDLSTLAGLNLVSGDIASMVKQNVPIRFGMIPIVEESEGEGSTATITARVVRYINSEYGKVALLQFLAELKKEAEKQPSLLVTATQVRKAFDATNAMGLRPRKPGVSNDFDEITSPGGKYNSLVIEARNFMKRMGIPTKSKGAFFVNGKYFDFDESYQRNIMQTLNAQLEYVQLQLYTGKISGDVDIYDYFLTREQVKSKRSQWVTESDIRPLTFGNILNSEDFVQTVPYFSAAPDSLSTPISLWISGDMSQPETLRLMMSAVRYAKTSSIARLAFAHYASRSAGGFGQKAGVMVSRIACGKGDLEAEKLGRLETFLSAAIENGSTSVLEPPDLSLLASEDEAVAAEDAVKVLLAKAGVPSNGAYITINGRLLGPFSGPDGNFDEEEFEVLETYEFKERISPAQKAIERLGLQPMSKESSGREISKADFIMGLCAIIGYSNGHNVPRDLFVQKGSLRSRDYELLGEETRFAIGRKEDATFQIGAIIDPLSDAAQKWSTILDVLGQLAGTYVEVHLNPVTDNLTDLPLKRFYRYVLSPELRFDNSTGRSLPPVAEFRNVPTDPLFTLGIDVIGPWVVSAVESVHDLDNIRLNSVEATRGVEALLELENILVEGHARDMTTGGPPRGLEFVLSTRNLPESRNGHYHVDTIVMANFGYLQLKANPGVWNLGLREGRSAELFDIESAGSQGWDSSTIDEIGTAIVVRSFNGIVIYPRVRRKPGKEFEDVLAEPQTDQGFWNKIKSAFYGSIKPKNEKKAVINVFSVASGHLYERFMSIMILSVIKNTNSSVKFWLIENFLSPSFKKFVPYMAAKYNFEFEFVTYKWPYWLRGQTEKQRTIWGYKILFLDVLFPLDLDKVIFVDADQVVRADLKELVDMDMHGAPYAYTPFCDSRREMEGFRFWKQGYWSSHLKGRPYHISALYVIDLHRFRQIAAGDRLRGQYQLLSADRSSLANLDQDLPNNMQEQVPIYSLPIEWLWCETWCDDASLKKAKTIDLCNNPQTKEPKLERAKRLLPEWEAFDNEVNELRKTVASSIVPTASPVEETQAESTDVPHAAKLFHEDL